MADLASILSGSGSQLPAAAMGLATGMLQQISGGGAKKLQRKADAAMPGLIDPNQASYLAELNQKRRSIETGSDFEEAMREADTSQASANDAILAASGGNTSGAIQGILAAQRGAVTMKNKALAEGQGQQMAYDNAYGNMLNKISSRKMELQLLRSQQYRAEWARKKQMGGQNVNAGLAGIVGVAANKIPEMMQSAPAAAPPSVDAGASATAGADTGVVPDVSSETYLPDFLQGGSEGILAGIGLGNG